MKIGVIGSGMVGGSAAFAAVMTGAASEIVLVDVNEKLAQAQSEDILHAVPYAHPARVSAGDFGELEGAGVVLICCGVAQRPGNQAATAQAERRHFCRCDSKSRCRRPLMRCWWWLPTRWTS